MMPAYLTAHFAKSQLWHASTLLFGFFLTEVCAIEAWSMGRIMAASLLLNGLIDLGLGVRLRNRIVCVAGAGRLQARAAPLTCLCFLLFCVTPLVETDLRAAWALVTLLAFRASYPLLDVPQNAIVALLPISDDGRCALLARRNIASGVAGIAVSAIAAPMLIHGADLTGWLVWGTCLSLLVCGSAWWVAQTKWDGAFEPETAHGDIGSDLPFEAILCGLAVMIAASAMFRTIEPYYASFVGQSAGLLLWAAVGGTVSQPLWLWCRRRWSGSGVLFAAAALLLLAAVALLGTSRASPLAAVLIGVGFGTGSSGLWLMLWSAMMNRAAAGRATGYVGTFTCVSKLAQSAAMLLTGHILAISPYQVTIRDPLSPPSLLMVGALAAIAAVCVALAFGDLFNRTAFGGRSATRRQAVPTVRGRG